MKKFVKVILILSTVFIVTGFGFVIAGSVTAGGMGTLVKQLKSGELNFGNWHFEDGVYYKGGVNVDVDDIITTTLHTLPGGNELAENVFTEDIRKIEITADLANLTIRRAGVEYVGVNMREGYAKFYEAKVKGDTLYVSYDVEGHSFKQGPKIIVEIPKDVELEYLSIDTDLGEVVLEKIAEPIQELDICASLGNIRIKDCELKGNSSVTAALGNIILEEVTVKNLELTANMGNVEFAGKVEGDLTVQADMGDIKVEVDGKEDDYNNELHTDMGKLVYNGKKLDGMNQHMCAGHGETIGDIILNCDMGNVELSFD